MGIRFNIPRPLPRLKIIPTPPKVVLPVYQPYTGGWRSSIAGMTVTNDGRTVTRSGNNAGIWNTAVTSGKIYLEVDILLSQDSGIKSPVIPMIGWSNLTGNSLFYGNSSNSLFYYDKAIWVNNNTSSPSETVTGLPAVTASFVMMLARDVSTGKFWWGINGTWFNNATPAKIANGTNFVAQNGNSMPFLTVDSGFGPGQIHSFEVNQGQKAYKYEKPAGFTPMGSPT